MKASWSWIFFIETLAVSCNPATQVKLRKHGGCWSWLKNIAQIDGRYTRSGGSGTGLLGFRVTPLNGFTDSISKTKKAAVDSCQARRDGQRLPAGAEAHLTGRLAVCAGSCGPGNMHLVNGLYDCHRSRVPVLAIAAQIPSNEIGSGYFQENRSGTTIR